MTPSATHLVLIPSYDTGPQVYETVRAARAAWNPVWVVVDGSTDGTAEGLQRLAAQDDGLRVFVLPHNQGKGAAVLHGLQQAQAAGFTHALTMDADGQHPADHIARFMALSIARPGAMILGRPMFAADAPALRVQGRKVSNFWTNLETLWAGVDDSLFGFRVYPIAPLIAVMRGQPWMRRFDFDVEAVVRLCWRGVQPVSTGTGGGGVATGNLGIGTDSIGAIAGILYDDAEKASSFTFSDSKCQVKFIITNSLPRTAPRFTTIVPSGRSGWMKLYNYSGAPLLGAVINFNSAAAASPTAFNQGHNLHKLRLAESSTFKIPVFPPNCG